MSFKAGNPQMDRPNQRARGELTGSSPAHALKSANSNGALDAETREDLASYRGKLFAYFRRRTRTVEDTEDLVQEVLLRLSRSSAFAKAEQVEGYVMACARNALFDWRSRNRRTSDHVSVTADIEDTGFSPERVLVGRDALAMVVAGLQALPPRTSTIFAMHHFNGMSHREIGLALGIAVRTVEDHMARANSRIREASALNDVRFGKAPASVGRAA